MAAARKPRQKPTLNGAQLLALEQKRDEIFRMAKLGMRDNDIATVKGISEAQLKRNFAPQLKEGRVHGYDKVLETAFDMATSGKCPLMTKFWLQVRLRWAEAKEPDAPVAPPSVKVLTLGTSDPVEASRIYEEFMKAP